MSTEVRQLLDLFDALSESEKYEASLHLLQRIMEQSSGELPEAALIAAADELFLKLDAEE